MRECLKQTQSAVNSRRRIQIEVFTFFFPLWQEIISELFFRVKLYHRQG